MPAPVSFEQMPMGLRRACLVGSRHVLLIDGDWARSVMEYTKLVVTLPAPQRDKKYVVFSFPSTYHDFNAGTYTITIASAAQVKGFGEDTWDELGASDAVGRYEILCRDDAGVPKVLRGINGLKKIGKLDP